MSILMPSNLNTLRYTKEPEGPSEEAIRGVTRDYKYRLESQCRASDSWYLRNSLQSLTSYKLHSKGAITTDASLPNCS